MGVQMGVYQEILASIQYTMLEKCKGKQAKINNNKTIKYIRRILFITAWSINSLLFAAICFYI